jgi:hypothetical protein
MPWNPEEYIIPLLGGSDKVEAPLLKNKSEQLAFRLACARE